MFSVCRPATWYRRQSFDSLDFAIQLVEDHVARTAALSARLATAGYADAAIYARASLELGQLYLDLLRRGQFRLLMGERLRAENCAAIKASLFNAPRLGGEAGLHRPSPATLLIRGAGSDRGWKLLPRAVCLD